jgi:hypothetical protein
LEEPKSSVVWITPGLVLSLVVVVVGRCEMGVEGEMRDKIKTNEAVARHTAIPG